MTETMSPLPPGAIEPNPSTQIADLEQQVAAGADSEALGLDLETRLAAVQEEIQGVRDRYNVDDTGRSSFYDVTGNTLASARSAVGYWRDDPEDLAELALGTEVLERYMGVLRTHPDILEGEITRRDGAFPELRLQADQEAQQHRQIRAIPRYVELLEQTVSAEEQAQSKFVENP